MNNCEIGEAAGRVWQCLCESGEMNLASLAKRTGLKPDLLHAAIGWLARESKLNFRPDKRKLFLSLL